MVADSTLGWPPGVAMDDPVSGVNPHAPIIHLHREVDDYISFGLFELLQQSLVHIEILAYNVYLFPGHIQWIDLFTRLSHHYGSSLFYLVDRVLEIRPVTPILFK